MAPGTSGLGRAQVEAAFRHVTSDLAVDPLGVLAPRRQYVRHQTPGHRPNRDDEREDAQVDGAAAALHGQLWVLAHSEDHVGRDLTGAESRDRSLPRLEVPLDAGPRLGRCDVGQDGGIERFDVNADRIDAEIRDLVDDVEIPRRFELNFHRQPGRRLDAWPQRAT